MGGQRMVWRDLVPHKFEAQGMCEGLHQFKLWMANYVICALGCDGQRLEAKILYKRVEEGTSVGILKSGSFPSLAPALAWRGHCIQQVCLRSASLKDRDVTDWAAEPNSPGW